MTEQLKGKEKKESEVVQSCPTVCDAMDCSLPGSSVHGIFQAIVLEWIAISFSRGSSQPRARTQVSRIVDRRFTVWATRAGFSNMWTVNFQMSKLVLKKAEELEIKLPTFAGTWKKQESSRKNIYFYFLDYA